MKTSHQLRELADYGLFDMPFAERQRRGWTVQQMSDWVGSNVRKQLTANTAARKGWVPAPYTAPERKPAAAPWWRRVLRSMGRLGGTVAARLGGAGC